MKLGSETTRRGTEDRASFAFAALVLAHAACGEDVIEARLDDGAVACECLRCKEKTVFGPTNR